MEFRQLCNMALIPARLRCYPFWGWILSISVAWITFKACGPVSRMEQLGSRGPEVGIRKTQPPCHVHRRTMKGRDISFLAEIAYSSRPDTKNFLF